MKPLEDVISQTQSQMKDIELKLACNEPVKIIHSINNVSEVSSDNTKEEDTLSSRNQEIQPLREKLNYHDEPPVGTTNPAK